MSKIANSITAPNEAAEMDLEGVRRLAQERLATNPSPGTSYAGDVMPGEAWQILAESTEAVLVDVRTDAEWNFVGRPDLTALSKKPLLISWQRYPDMAKNKDFSADLSAAGVAPNSPILFLCRSGVRSISAAQHSTAQGFSDCFNILEGFEGGHDDNKHRGLTSGWKMRGLPWMQG